MSTSYRTRMRRATWLAFGTAVLGGIGAGVVVRSVEPGEHFWPVLAVLLAVCALALWACLPWWQRMDDMQKQGHAVSWYWGGIGGGIAALMWLVAAVGVDGEQARGGLLVLLGQTAGFLLFWVVWARRRRGPEA